MHRLRHALAALLLLLPLAACGGTDSGDSDKTTIALFLPESKTTRYEAFDKPLFEAKVKKLCPDCEVLVLDGVAAAAAAPLVNQAKQRNVPVIAYDRLISGISYEYYVSFDNVRVGEVQGKALLDEVTRRGKTGKVVMLNGSPTDPSSADYKKGAHQALDGKIDIGREYDTPDWSPDKAQQEMEEAVTSLGRDSIVGVYSANDGMASGAVAAMKRAGYPTLPPITGQDAELAAVQRILTGEQTMTVYLDIRAQAEKSAELAVALAKHEKPSTPTKVVDIPAFLLDPIAVDKDSIKDTIVKDGFYTVDQICTPEVAAACAEAGLK